MPPWRSGGAATTVSSTMIFALICCAITARAAWTGNSLPITRSKSHLDASTVSSNSFAGVTRRKALLSAVAATSLSLNTPGVALAYTPDTDKLRESLYLMSRVQEATVQQERLVKNSKLQEELKTKMKLSLRLVDRSYRLLDQINYSSNFVTPQAELVTAVAAGNEAVESLQSAIDYVADELGVGPMTDLKRDFLMSAMQSTREDLFTFLNYMPADKLGEARRRVETENVDNREEFDGDSNAGVYNPVVLPWKNK